MTFLAAAGAVAASSPLGDGVGMFIQKDTMKSFMF